MTDRNPLLEMMARAFMNPVVRDQAQSAVMLKQKMADQLSAPAQAWKRMVDSGYQPTGQANDPARDQMAQDAMDVSGAVTVGGMPFAKPGTLGSAGGKGIRAYHGSPHDFDRFSLDKIGTGEGAQAYGHGLYFAESEGVAKSYRDALGGHTSPALESARAKEILAELEPAIKKYGVMNLPPKYADKAKEIADIAKRGRMYEVRINADPNDFLDWDKPIKQQPENVRSALNKILTEKSTIPGDPHQAYKEAVAKWEAGPRTTSITEDPDVSRAWDAMQVARQGPKVFDNELPRYTLFDAGRASPEEWQKALVDRGIPGVKYLDAGSRRAGDGSRNYVLFRDDIIDIVRKYGIGAAASLYGMDAVMQAQRDADRSMIAGALEQ